MKIKKIYFKFKTTSAMSPFPFFFIDNGNSSFLKIKYISVYQEYGNILLLFSSQNLQTEKVPFNNTVETRSLG